MINMLDMVYNKRMNILMILGVLLKYTDYKNPIYSQEDIQKLVIKEYGVKINRVKGIGENLRTLKDFLDNAELGYVLDYKTERRRNERDGSAEVICHDWYIERDISNSELIPLIDGLLFSKYIPYSRCKDLIEKLEKLSGANFKREHRLQSTEAKTDKTKNDHLFLTVEVLSEAIAKQKKVEFNSIIYGTDTDAPLRLYLDDDGTPHKYNVSPYEIAITNGRYYLICSHSIGDLFHYRLDFIRNIKLMKKEEDGDDTDSNYLPNRPVSDFKAYITKSNPNELDLAKYMREHIYMYSGKSTPVKFIADKTVNAGIVYHVRDWFGDGARLTNDTPEKVEVNVMVNENAMLYWALQYGPSIEVIEPVDLRGKIATEIAKMHEKYCGGKGNS